MEEKDVPLFAHEFSKVIEGSHFLELKSVYALHDTLFSPRRLTFHEYYTRAKSRRPDKYLRYLPLLLTRPIQVEKAVWITDEWCSNYFHWLTDALTRLVAVQPYLTKEHALLLPGNYKDLPFVRETLEYFDIPVVYFSQQRAARIGYLILPSHIACSGNYHREVIHELRSRFPAAVGKPSRKIYISRHKAGRRKTANEEEVQQTMRNLGFEVHFFEDYSFRVQIQIMGETRCLVGLHGAGLTNMLFMPAGSSVLELRNAEDAHNNCYYSMASEMGLVYYYQLNQGDSSHTTTATITVDVEALAQNVALLTA